MLPFLYLSLAIFWLVCSLALSALGRICWAKATAIEGKKPHSDNIWAFIGFVKIAFRWVIFFWILSKAPTL